MKQSGKELRVQQLSRTFSDWTLQADFRVQPHQRVALVAPSGSGKTSLLKMIAGLEPFDSGRLFYGDEEMTHWPIQKRKIGFLFQDQRLFSHLSIFENLTFGLQMQGISKKECQKHLEPWLDAIQLKHRLEHSIEGLSGGEKQRIAWARALIWKPQMIFLDEPWNGLDSEMRSKLIQHFIEFHKNWPVPVLFVSHQAEDIQDFATHQLQFEQRGSTVIFTGG